MRYWFFVFFILFVTPCSVLAGNKIYVIKQSDGSLKFSTKPPTGGEKTKVFTSKRSGFSWYRMSGKRSGGKLFTTKYDREIEAASREFNVEESLLRAVIHVESAFNPKAVSPKGALGLMQIMPFNLRKLGVKDPFKPQDNVRGGARLLSQLKKRYSGNTSLILAAYNAGEEAVKRYNGIPPYRETQQYVKRVIDFRRRYQQQI